MDSLKAYQRAGGFDQFIHTGQGSDNVIRQVIHTQNLSRGQATVRLAAEDTRLVTQFSLKGREGAVFQLIPEMPDGPGGVCS